jgi:hypothetical protein
VIRLPIHKPGIMISSPPATPLIVVWIGAIRLRAARKLNGIARMMPKKVAINPSMIVSNMPASARCISRLKRPVKTTALSWRTIRVWI